MKVIKKQWEQIHVKCGQYREHLKSELGKNGNKTQIKYKQPQCFVKFWFKLLR